MRLLPSPAIRRGRRLTAGAKTAAVSFTTKGAIPYTEFAFAPDDILLFGQESSGAPDHVHNAADARLLIPVQPGVRSLNIVQAAAMALGEALRQTRTAA